MTAPPTARNPESVDDRMTLGRGLLSRLAFLTVQYPVRIVLVVTALTGIAGVSAFTVSGQLRNGGYIPANAESERADTFVATRFDAGTPDLVVVAGAGQPVDAPAIASAGRALTDYAAGRGDIASAISYWSTGAAELKSRDGDSALLLIRLAGSEQQREDNLPAILADLTGHAGILQLHPTGATPVDTAIIDQSEKDLVRAELLATPVTIVILLVAFGAVIAAGMPVIVAIVSVLGALGVLHPIAAATDVSVFALNVATALGFGLAVDYCLFIITRYREEIAAGRDNAAAVQTAVTTAGRTVLFSAGTVLLALSALLVFPLVFLRSIAYAAILVVAFGALASVVVLPALLALLGPRLLAWPARRVRAPGRGWRRLAEAVMRRPIVTAVPLVVILLFLAAPFAGARFGLADARVLPASAPAARAAATVDHDFDHAALTVLTVVLPGVGRDRAGELSGYSGRLAALPHALRVDSSAGRYVSGRQQAPAGGPFATMSTATDSYLTVVFNDPVFSAAAQQLVRDVRGTPSPAAAAPLVGGTAATYVDTRDAIAARLPWAVLVMAASIIVVLFLFTGSVVVPFTAILLNLLSLTATFGAMVYVFQDGHLRGLVGGFTPTGYLELTIPILVFCIAFGLSMDYEVFLLSRIREEYVRHGDNRRSVVAGIESTGRVITAAALIVASVLICLATSQLSMLKLLGVALALAVLVDAILVRGILVPAFMRLLGRANWWAPGPLTRLHERIGLREP